MPTYFLDFILLIAKRVVMTKAATNITVPKKLIKIMNTRELSLDNDVSCVLVVVLVVVVVEFGVDNMICDTATEGRVVEVF